MIKSLQFLKEKKCIELKEKSTITGGILTHGFQNSEKEKKKTK